MSATPFDVSFLETFGGPFVRYAKFIEALKSTNPPPSLTYKVGMKTNTLEPAICISIDGSDPHPFTVTEVRGLADIFEQTLEDGHEGASYSEMLAAVIKDMIGEMRRVADLSDAARPLMMKVFVPKH